LLALSSNNSNSNSKPKSASLLLDTVTPYQNSSAFCEALKERRRRKYSPSRSSAPKTEVDVRITSQTIPHPKLDTATVAQPAAKDQPGGVLFASMKGASARGQRTANGFVVFKGSTAVFEERKSSENYPYVVAQRKELIAEGTLIDKDGFLVFTKDVEFSSPSAAAVVIHGGSANGLISRKNADGKTLRQLDEQA